jgi:hypothetical protein
MKQLYTTKQPQKYCPKGMRSFTGQRRPAKIFDTAECINIQLPSAFACRGEAAGRRPVSAGLRLTFHIISVGP